jgi:hypothetical protein
MPGIWFTPSLLSVFCNLLSSVVVVLWIAFFFLEAQEPGLYSTDEPPLPIQGPPLYG